MSIFTQQRTTIQLKNLWENIKSTYKNKLTARKRETFQTSGGRSIVLEDTFEDDPDIELMLGSFGNELEGAVDCDSVHSSLHSSVVNFTFFMN